MDIIINNGELKLDFVIIVEMKTKRLFFGYFITVRPTFKILISPASRIIWIMQPYIQCPKQI